MRRAVAIAVALPWLGWALVRTLGLDLGYPLVPAMAYTPYVLADRRVRALGVQAVQIPGSDHRALVARLRLPRRA